MSLSLYRRWRPRTFSDLVGQEAVVRTLQTALSSGKLAHAYLFSGPRGSGKTSAAKILARCIECESGPAPEPDNTCENCLAILAGTALDVLEIDAASNRGIDEIRALRESVKFAPAVMRSKVFIIDEAHMLTREGANAFLKTLEEPPAHAIFILATTAPEALPPTILSRCQRYAFRRITIPTMIERMREIATAEGFAIGDEALGAIAYRADGGLRDALTMLEQVASFAGPGATIDALTVEAAFGTTGRVYARALVEALLAADAGAALRTIDAASDAGTDMAGLMRTTIGEFRNLLVGRIDAELLSRDLSPDDAERTRALAAVTPQARVVRALRLLADALAAGRLAGNPRLELETAALRFVLQGEDPTLEALSARMAALEAGAPATPGAPVTAAPRSAAPAAAPPERAHVPPLAAPAPRPEPPQAAEAAAPREPGAATPRETGPPTLQRIRSLWDQIRTRVYEKAKPIQGPLSRATVDALEDGTLTIRIVDAPQEEYVRGKAALIEDALEQLLGTRLRVAIVCAGGASARAARASSAHRAGPAIPGGGPAAPASAEELHGENDLLAYARIKLAGAPGETETTQ